MTTMTEAAAAFTATEAIKAGDWDQYLVLIRREVNVRLRILEDHDRPPPKTQAMIASGHQVWVWMQGPGKPHWEIRGTGLILDDSTNRPVE